MFPERLLIRADGSHQIGLGHIFRMRTLALSARSMGSDVMFVSLVDETSSRLLADVGLRQVPFESNNRLSVVEEVVRSHSPEVVVYDLLGTERNELQLLRELGVPRIVTIDDDGAGVELADVVVNSQVAMWSRPCISAGARVLRGPEFMILDQRIEQLRERGKSISSAAKHVLIAMGGTDTYSVTERVVEALDQVGEPLQVVVNLGPGTAHSERLEAAVTSSPHQVDLRRSIADLIGEFLQSDLVICAGGVMLYELAALGVPSLCIGAERHEVQNAEYWEARGTTVSLGWERELVPAVASRLITNLLADPDRRGRMSRAGRRAMDGRGLQRVMALLHREPT